MSQMPPPMSPSPLPTGHRCVRCGYDLSGSMIGGACPECGTPVAQSLAANAGGGTNSGKATASLVLGIVALPGLMACCVPGMVLGILAIVFGYSAKREIANGEASPSSGSAALAGIICGAIALGLGLLWLSGYVVMLIVNSTRF